MSERALIGGRYRLVRRTGRGPSGGEQWVAQDEDLGTEVLLTELPLAPGAVGGEVARLRQARERADQVGQLRRHAHVVPLHDVVEHEGDPWVVTAYQPGAVDLATRLRQDGPVPAGELAGIALALAGALGAGHALGVLHGQVSPSAVLLIPEEADGQVPEQVLLTGYRFSGTVPPAGTEAGFLAPEQAREPGRAATPAADVYALGATLYAAAEGHPPPAPPDIPVRAQELAGLVREMLAEEPTQRPSADKVRATLERLIGPGTDDPGAEEEGKRPGGEGAEGVGAGAGPDGNRRRFALRAGVWRPVAVAAVVVLIAATGTLLALTAGGSGTGKGQGQETPSASPPASHSAAVFPYGQSVGLTEPLTTGDCVSAVWAGRPLASVPNLGVVDCGDGNNAQVVAMMDFPSVEAARSGAARQCARQADEVAGRLPDAGAYAVVPTAQGFEAAGRRAACLVASRHIPFNGEVGRFRDNGIDLNLQQMAVGDCWTYKEKKDTFQALLASSCSESHTDQVVGFVEAPQGMSADRAFKSANDLCRNRFDAAWAPDDDTAVLGYVINTTDWKNGFRQVVCTVGRADGKPVTGAYEPSGS
ncbi:septum formation family protein [Streptomyces sp. NPDC018019]|uniref:septum formation family protein n=1 Tax=Streptomyces sp. NPDC018019 TaxID=3365030 RepID=UPI003797933E